MRAAVVPRRFARPSSVSRGNRLAAVGRSAKLAVLVDVRRRRGHPSLDHYDQSHVLVESAGQMWPRQPRASLDGPAR